MTTLGNVIDAIEKNGYEQITGKFIINDPILKLGKIKIGSKTKACAFGQAALNLRIRHQDLWMRIASTYEIRMFPSRVVELNDHLKLSIPEIVKSLREEYKDRLDVVINYGIRENPCP